MIRKDPARSIPRITLKLYTRGPLRLEPGLDFSISRSAAPAWQPAGARARIRPARRNVEVEPVKDARVGPGRVREADAAQRELPLDHVGLEAGVAAAAGAEVTAAQSHAARPDLSLSVEQPARSLYGSGLACSLSARAQADSKA